MARFYANENFPLPVVDLLRRLGHDILTVQETGHGGESWPDQEVLAFAHNDNRVLLTFNRKHFVRLHNAGRQHSGIVTCTLDVDFPSLAARIHDAVGIHAPMEQKLVRINRPSTSMNGA